MAGRLTKRGDSLARRGWCFGDLGAISVRNIDPDVQKMLGPVSHGDPRLMAGTASQIHAAASNALATVPGLRVRRPPARARSAPPMAVIQLETVTYHRTMQGGTSEWAFLISLIAGLRDRALSASSHCWLSYDGAGFRSEPRRGRPHAQRHRPEPRRRRDGLDPPPDGGRRQLPHLRFQPYRPR
jgi:hypothetical protein